MATTQKYREGLGRAAGARAAAAPDGQRRRRSRSSGFMRFQWARCWRSVAWCRRSTSCFPRIPRFDLHHNAHRPGAGARTRSALNASSIARSICPGPCAPISMRCSRRMLILAETEFWPNLLNGCFRRGIPVAVVNARISDRSWPRYQMLRRLWRPILGRSQPRAGAERNRRGAPYARSAAIRNVVSCPAT